MWFSFASLLFTLLCSAHSQTIGYCACDCYSLGPFTPVPALQYKCYTNITNAQCNAMNCYCIGTCAQPDQPFNGECGSCGLDAQPCTNDDINPSCRSGIVDTSKTGCSSNGTGSGFLFGSLKSLKASTFIFRIFNDNEVFPI